MARSHAKFYVHAWRDDEWRDLGRDAQWLYWLLLTQPKLTLVGSLEITEGRWSQLAKRTSREEIHAALVELVVTAKVLTDETTDELLIRSFTKNDLDPNRVNVNLAKGLWGQWAAIESHRLRIAAVDGMPDDLWAKLGPHAPPDAVDIRRSARLEPDVRTDQSELEVPTSGRDASSEPPLSSYLPPDASHRPGPSDGNPQAAGLAQRALDVGRRLQLVDEPQGRGETATAS